MWGDPGCADAKSVATPLEQLDKRCVAQCFGTPFPPPSDEEDDRGLRVTRPLVHHVAAQGGECFGLMEVDHSLHSRLRASTLRVVGAIPHDDPPTPILDIVEVQVENLTRS